MSGKGISGFTIVRNAQKLDYPFLPSVRSLLPLCDEVILNCGDSSDDTFKWCEQLRAQHPDKIKIIQSVWDRQNQQGGWQLKQQSDVAMNACQGRWCFYLQADEVLHEEDYAKILAAKEKAERDENVDGVLFDWVHFYGNYQYEIRGRNWYRREVRLFKNHRQIEAFRDAQGFRRQGGRLRVVSSGARVFHYGYVRTASGLKTKSAEMAQWWGQSVSSKEEAFALKRHVGLRRFNQSHPSTMVERVASSPLAYDPRTAPLRWDKDEIKNAVTLVWETFFPFRIGEFRNYKLVSS